MYMCIYSKYISHGAMCHSRGNYGGPKEWGS